ncbi:hypothetical protein XELAEV_18008678mg [Xenopus laevis]|uniref:G-protein coupled receptors family 3 profile domain-containing protein n=1 Tax=Xenopus laevis TaxID=8355 RepID=A0A974DSZ0_XENLA|nr:hypothetical protein XELAEV_18008678mg [Xenopus laevis]
MLGVSAPSISLKVLIYVLILYGGPCSSGNQSLNSACHLGIIQSPIEYEYIQAGDIIIGGVMAAHLYTQDDPDTNDTMKGFVCSRPSREHSKYLLDFRYAIDQTNKDPTRLPNLTLGYHIYDSCLDAKKAVKSVLQILSGTREPVPNYSCVGKRNIAGFIGDLISETTVPIAQILTLYGYSQISYGATDPSLGDRRTFPYFFRTVQTDENNYFALGKLLRYFGWTWVGLITSDDISGMREDETLRKYLSREDICVEFTVKINRDLSDQVHLSQDSKIIQNSTTGVIIIGGTVSLIFVKKLVDLTIVLTNKTLILSSVWGINHYVLIFTKETFNGSLSIRSNYPYNLISREDMAYLANLNQFKYPNDTLLEDLWLMFFSCLTQNQAKNDYYSRVLHIHNCTGAERFTNLGYFQYFTFSPRVHLAVHIMSCAIDKMEASLSEKLPKKQRFGYSYRNQLHHYLKTIIYYTRDGQASAFNKFGDYGTNYGIFNNILNSALVLRYKFVGTFTPWDPPDQRINISSHLIIWKTKDTKIPRAQCSDNCLPGFRKAPKTGAKSCCYHCVWCSEREISNRTDSEICIQCPDMEWPNEEKNQCVPKMEQFLSYTNYVISVVLSSISLLFFLITLLILRVYISYWDTPIVRANHRSLSFLLLVSIKLSFLSVFLFLGRPVDITCMLRIITFGITFSIAVSSLMAKTIMVCVAFKATKPGSSWRKWVGVKLSNSLVLFCSSIQIIICMTWLAISPPFQELDLHTYPGTIIIQCNEGSAIGFYSVIGYMGLLAAVSFVLAFLARTLPDSFNEAKYITFSMLLFCSVWITMIPAYLSTKGKNTVCVEIFAILTSSAGLLACIFLPKCYIIYFLPERNTKSHVLGSKY